MWSLLSAGPIYIYHYIWRKWIQTLKATIPAHKFVLSISSPVFYSELAETTDSTEMPDCDYDSVLELFRYCTVM